MSSPTDSVHSHVHASTYPLTRCHARGPSFPRPETRYNTTEEETEDAEVTSSLALHAIDSLVVERRKRTRIGFCSRQSNLEQRCHGEFPEEGEEDVDVEGLGGLALRAVNSIELIRQESDKLKMGSAKSRISKRERVRSWIFGVWYRA